jgi:hypothetical protein
VYRRATFTEPGLTAQAVTAMAPDATFNGNATWPTSGMAENNGTASVLYLQQGPAQGGCPTGATGCAATGRAAGAGLFFGFPAGAATNAIAFDETTGQRVWTANVKSGGDGIRGTPVIDPTSRQLFVVTGANPHVVHALSVDTGVEVTTGGWPVTLSNATLSYTDPATSTKVTFNSGSQNQHGASLLVNNILYIPFGGHYGDGGTYNGWIVAVDITNPMRVGGWATIASPMANPDSRSGIWGSGGLASDGTYVFGVTGDTWWPAAIPAAHSGDSQELVRVTGLAQFTRDHASVFVPTEWTNWDRSMAGGGNDWDYGASTPAFVPLPAGSNPPSLVVSPAKAGHLFVLDGTDLSSGTYPNAGGELADVVVSSTNGETVYTAPTIYTSASGLHATINVGGGQPSTGCQAGAAKSQEQLISVLLQPGQMPVAKVAWCASNSAGGGHQNYPPISTTTDGVSANALVWFINGTQLEAIDGDTGAHVVTTNGAACNNVPSMSFPIAANNRIVVASLAGLCSWSLNGM